MTNAHPEPHRFALGAFACLTVSDGSHVYKARTLHGGRPQEETEPALRAYGIEGEDVTIDYLTLVIQTDAHRVLVDTGLGQQEDGPNFGHLQTNLAMAGIAPEAIDRVILTHAHPDHIGGALDAQGHAAFSNARYLLWRAEWEFWLGEPDERALLGVAIPEEMRNAFAGFAREKLLPIQDRIELIEPGGEIVPGIRAVAAPGHTAGHLALDITSGGERLLVIGDAALHPVQLERPEWVAPVDLRPAQMVATRRQLLHRAATDGVLVHASHFPFPGLGHVAPKGDAWVWQPVG